MKIVVGYDGSEHARRALERVGELGKNGEPVTVVSAADVALMAGPASPDTGNVPAHKRALEEASSALASKGLTVQAVLAEGDPADAIVDEAKKTAADLIVVGTRGLNTAERVVLGSVSTKIVHHAPCDVLVVR
jgi:nucleotide-binding universal stress UspA family protein